MFVILSQPFSTMFTYANKRQPLTDVSSSPSYILLQIKKECHADALKLMPLMEDSCKSNGATNETVQYLQNKHSMLAM